MLYDITLSSITDSCKDIVLGKLFIYIHYFNSFFFSSFFLVNSVWLSRDHIPAHVRDPINKHDPVSNLIQAAVVSIATTGPAPRCSTISQINDLISR